MLSDKLKIVRKAISVTKCKAACAVWLKLSFEIIPKMINLWPYSKKTLARQGFILVYLSIIISKNGLRYSELKASESRYVR
jgi:hypothetical protein